MLGLIVKIRLRDMPIVLQIQMYVHFLINFFHFNIIFIVSLLLLFRIIMLLFDKLKI
jgi:hypothetical protein